MAAGKTGQTTKGQATKERIMLETVKLIKTKGYDQTTLVDICQAAEVSNGAFYHYFNSKQDILLAFVDQESRDMEDYYRILKKNSYLEVLYMLVSYQTTYFQIKGQDFLSNFYSSMLLLKKNFFLIEDYVMLRLLRDCFENGQRTGDFRDDLDADFMAYTVNNLLYGISATWCMDEGKSDLNEMVKKRFVPLVELYAAKRAGSTASTRQ